MITDNPTRGAIFGGLVALLALLAAQLAFTATAGAFVGYSTPTFFGAEGSAAGQFKEPAGVAVDETTKDVYVYDAGNRRVQWFDSAGKFEGQLDGSGSPTGQFAAPAKISEHAAHGTLFNLAIDNDPSSPSVGDVYIVDPGRNVIDKFTATGAYLSQLTGFKRPIFGVAVDTSGDVWVEEEGIEAGGNHGIFQEFDDSVANGHVTEVVAEKLRSPGIALDSDQNLYVLKGEPDVVKFDKTGAFLAELTGCSCDTALAVNAANDELLVDQQTDVARFGAFGTPFEESIAGLAASYGVAVDGGSATRDLYASQREANTVAIFKYGLLPDVTTGAASAAQRTTVSLAGEVDPDGREVSSCRFEYGATTSYGQSVACSAPAGSGSSPVPVSAEATGLTPQTTYHYRLVAGNATAAHAGGDQEFTTEPAVENVLTEAAPAVTGTTATLTGSFEPNTFDTGYRFEYHAPGAPPTFTPLQDGGSASEDKHVSTAVTGLRPKTLYFYRILTENNFGQTAGGEGLIKTQVLAPAITGSPGAPFVAAQTADLHATLNPLNTTTHYSFQYGACATLGGCTNIQNTPSETSSVYGTVGSTVEVVGLEPSTTYAYRLVAVNEYEEGGETKHDTTIGEQGTFTTPPAAVPGVQTGQYSILSPTSAAISGIVEANGVPTSYAFELGVGNGPDTQFGIVSSGAAETSEEPTPVAQTLTGLQPGTTYAYRLSISSGYIPGQTHTIQAPAGQFTTPGLPAAIGTPPLLAQLPVPNIALPGEPTRHTTPRKLSRAKRLANALSACARRPKHRRAACRRQAKMRYGGAPRHKH